MITLTAADLTLKMVIIVVVGVFAASFIDAIAGGGGMISVPAYLLAGLPAHIAMGTNKMSACIGTAVSTGRFIKKGYVDWRLAVPAVALAILGSVIGTKLQLMVPESWLQYVLLVSLPVIAILVLRQHTLPETRGEIDPQKQLLVVCLAGICIGVYDGFYGPGTGTFLILSYCNFAKLDVRTASGNAKVANLASNVGAVTTSLLHGKVFVALGCIAAVASIAGHWLGSGLALKNGSKIVKPAVVVVLLMLAVKVLRGLFAG